MKAAVVRVEQPRTEDPTAVVVVADSYDITHPKKRAMLAAYSRIGNISHACEAARIARRTHYDWLESDADYKEAFRQAGEDAADALEAEARRRAFAGSDLLLIFLLKGLRPEKYRERYDHRLQEAESYTFGPVRFRGGREIRDPDKLLEQS